MLYIIILLLDNDITSLFSYAHIICIPSVHSIIAFYERLLHWTMQLGVELKQTVHG